MVERLRWERMSQEERDYLEALEHRRSIVGHWVKIHWEDDQYNEWFVGLVVDYYEMCDHHGVIFETEVDKSDPMMIKLLGRDAHIWEYLDCDPVPRSQFNQIFGCEIKLEPDFF